MALHLLCLLFFRSQQLLPAFYSSQSDLTITAMLWSAILLAFVALKNKLLVPLILAGFCFGVAIGCKGTVIYFLPGLLVFALGYLWIERVSLKNVLWFVLFLVVGVILLGSQRYWMNYQEFGNPVAPKDEIERVQGGVDTDRIKFTTTNLYLYGLQLFLPDSNPDVIKNWTGSLLKEGTDYIENTVTVNPHYSDFQATWNRLKSELTPKDHIDEINASFGLPIVTMSFLGMILLFPMVADRDKRKNGLHLLLLSLATISFFVVFAALSYWTTHKFRYFILALPVISLLAIHLVQFVKGKLQSVIVAILGILFFLAPLQITNVSINGIGTVFFEYPYGQLERRIDAENLVENLSTKANEILIRNDYHSWVSPYVRASNDRALKFRLVSHTPEDLPEDSVAIEHVSRTDPETSMLSAQPLRFSSSSLIRKQIKPEMRAMVKGVCIYQMRGIYPGGRTRIAFGFSWLNIANAPFYLQLRNPHNHTLQLIVQTNSNDRVINLYPEETGRKLELSGVTGFIKVRVKHEDPQAETEYGPIVQLPVTTLPSFFPYPESAVAKIIKTTSEGLRILPFIHSPWSLEENDRGLTYVWTGTSMNHAIEFAFHSDSQQKILLSIDGRLARGLNGDIASVNVEFINQNREKRFRLDVLKRRSNYKVPIEVPNGLSRLKIFCEASGERNSVTGGPARPLGFCIYNIEMRPLND
jgi:hypothetical protein